MKRHDRSIRDGIEDFLCPFEYMFITQGSGGTFSHKGTMANDVRGVVVGERDAYFTPCTSKCLKVYPSSGQSMWQSINKVRFANGRIDYATYMIAHDDSQDCFIGQVVKQGEQLGNMGTKGYATGVHCHIQISQSSDTSWYKNQYGIYQFNNEYDTDDCYFMDHTIILEGMGGSWKYLKDVPVENNLDVGSIYETLYNMYVRYGAGTNYPKKLVRDLTEDGKANATSDNPWDFALYKVGTKFTVYEFKDSGDGLWGRSPSGWICIKGKDGEEYCKKVS